MSDENAQPIRDDISNVASNPSELRKETEETVRFYDGEHGGYCQLESELNLNALAIGFGLDNIEYEPEVFPGLIYRSSDLNTTVIMFEDGQFTVVDASSESAANEAIMYAIERANSMGILGDIPDDITVVTSKTEADPSVPTINEDSD